jgi:hypothetical protein
MDLIRRPPALQCRGRAFGETTWKAEVRRYTALVAVGSISAIIYEIVEAESIDDFYPDHPLLKRSR